MDQLSLGWWVRWLRESAQDLLFPRRCVGCGRLGDFVCHACRASLPVLSLPYCSRCGVPYRGGVLCARCRIDSPAYDGLRSPYVFAGAIQQAIHQLKYRQVRGLAAVLGDLLAEYYGAHPFPGEVLIPVPLHTSRLRHRGYNQSGLLAEHLGGQIGLPVDEEGLRRQRDTAPQVRLRDPQERRRNVAGAFAWTGPGLNGKSVILIDDVATTGATIDCCAAALKEAGASQVWGLVLARSAGTAPRA